MPVNVEIKTRRGTAAEWASANPVLADGEPGLETDTGIIKYGDDVSHWDELPAANKQFQNVVTVAKSGKRGSADFICSEYDSDDECIQAAIDSLPSTGGTISIIDNPNIIYLLSSSLDIKGKSNIRIHGQCTFRRAQSLSSSLITNSGSSVGTHVLIQNTYGPGVKSISVATTEGFTVDSPIYIMELNSTNYERIDIIESIDSGTNTITLKTGLKRGTVSGTSYIANIIGFANNIQIEGIEFYDEVYEAASRPAMLQFLFFKKLSVKNLTFRNISGNSAIALAYSTNINISDVNIENVLYSTTDQGYGITIDSGTSCVNVGNCIINGCRHALTGDRAYDINYTNIIANSITLITSTSYSFDTHPYMMDIQYTNCISNGAYGGMNIRGQKVSVSNLTINNTSSTALTIQNVAKDVLISNLRIHNTGSWSTNATVYPVYINSTNVRINGIEIVQDTIPASSTMRGIYISGSSDISLSNFSISDRSNSTYSFVHGIELTGTNSKISLIDGKIDTYKNGGKSVVLSSATTNCLLRDIYTLQAVLNNGTVNVFENVSGYIAKNTGTATIPTSSTSIAVTHNLASTPTRVTVTPTSSTEGIAYYVPEELKTATTFTITMLSAPTANVSFDWSAVV